MAVAARLSVWKTKEDTEGKGAAIAGEANIQGAIAPHPKLTNSEKVNPPGNCEFFPLEFGCKTSI